MNISRGRRWGNELANRIGKPDLYDGGRRKFIGNVTSGMRMKDIGGKSESNSYNINRRFRIKYVFMIRLPVSAQMYDSATNFVTPQIIT